MRRPWVTTGVLVAVAATVLAVALVGRGDDDGDADGTGETVGDPARDDLRPVSDTALVAGRADNLAFIPTLVAPVSTPFTLEFADRGRAAASISPVLVDGREEAVAWPGGTPLLVEAVGDPPGSLTLDPTTVEAGPAGLVVSLGGVSGRLAPGTYRVTGSVAVGPEGLARPVDGLTFQATEATAVAFGGSTFLQRPPEAMTLEGPGEVVLVGDVEVATAEADRRVGSLHFGPGPYRFDLVWIGEHLEVDGRLEGEVRTDPPAG